MEITGREPWEPHGKLSSESSVKYEGDPALCQLGQQILQPTRIPSVDIPRRLNVNLIKNHISDEYLSQLPDDFKNSARDPYDTSEFATYVYATGRSIMFK